LNGIDFARRLFLPYAFEGSTKTPASEIATHFSPRTIGNNTKRSRPVTKPTSPSVKQRHGCVTTYLVLAIIANSATALLYLLGREAIKRSSPQHIPDWAFPVLIAVCLFNLVCAVALFRWKKWGFWGLVASAAVALCVNSAIGLGPLAAIGGIIGVLLLYGVLQIGKENKGWSQLESRRAS
jgi:hypothetical protein